MNKIKKGDQVVVSTGKDKGKRGEVKAILATGYAVVGGVNIVKRHQRPSPGRGVNGGIIEREMPIHISNIALFNPATGKPEKVGFRLLADGRKVRYFKSTNDVIDG